MRLHILLVVDPVALAERMQRLLAECEVSTTVTDRAESVGELLTRGEFDLVLIERGRLPVREGSWIAGVRDHPEQPEVIVLAEQEDSKDRAALLASGCLAVLNRHLADHELIDALRTLVRRRRQDAIRQLRVRGEHDQGGLDDFVSASPAMREFLPLVRRVTRSESSVLVLGETGVGKERLARAIHRDGPRSEGPFLAVNCGALSESLLESELFGHEEGAFTGARRMHRGYFELAHGGTVFLDEIGEMPLHLQVKLLRVLEERVVRRVGGETAIEVDVRIMAATHRELEDEVRARRFRADLYYRLAVVTLTLPPLRERPEDIPDLIERFLAGALAGAGYRPRRLSPEALQAVTRYAWPGNVRELRNVLERSLLLARGDRIELADLPRAISGQGSQGSFAGTSGEGQLLSATDGWKGDASHEAVGGQAATGPHPFGGDLLRRPFHEAKDEVIRGFERGYLEALLRESKGRIGMAAKRAHLNERTLYELMRRHGLDRGAFREDDS